MVRVYTPKFNGLYRVIEKPLLVHFRLHKFDNKPVSVPVHSNGMKPYFHPSSCPIDDSPDLEDTDLPLDSILHDIFYSNPPQLLSLNNTIPRLRRLRL